MNIVQRNIMPAQPPEVRINNFDEVALGYTPVIAKAEAERCLDCKNAPCMQGCPVGVKIPLFIRALREGDNDSALGIIRMDNNLPAICGRVCPQENQCEKYCVRRAKLGGSVAIGALERYAADSAHIENSPAKMTLDKRVAVVGSGPSSLTCAADLARMGVKVTIFEALHQAGGVLSYGIPSFRLPKHIVKEEIDRIKALGVEVVLNAVIGKTFTVEDLLTDFDAVFLGTGAGLPSFLGVKGENLSGVYSANEYLTRVNLMKAYESDSATPILRGKRVVVVGAGNVAMDSARTARRLGADVTLVYRRTRAEMPARAEEIEHAEEEGIEFMLLSNPVEILGEGKVEGIRLIRMELGEPDSSGRRSPHPIDGSEFTLECDGVIVALGTSPNPIIKNSLPALSTSPKGTVIVDGEGRTNIPRLYAGGDTTTGAATVILAMGAGKRAASAIISDFAEHK